VVFNAWTLNYAISELLVTYHNVDKSKLLLQLGDARADETRQG
jgi:hypothetical protein